MTNKQTARHVQCHVLWVQQVNLKNWSEIRITKTQGIFWLVFHGLSFHIAAIFPFTSDMFGLYSVTSCLLKRIK